jgi:hypothetical protein
MDSMARLLDQRCSLILESAPITEHSWRTLWQQGRWEAATHAARATQARILDLLIAHHAESNLAYRNRAIEELRGLIAWSEWVDPSHPHLAADFCSAEIAATVAIALDWLWEDIPEALRDEARRTLRDKAILPYLQAVREGAWWHNCYHSWNAVTNGAMAVACLAMCDECDEAREAARLAREGMGRFFDALGRDGGWDEGLGRWAVSMRYVLLAAEASKRLDDDQAIYHRRGLDETGLFGIYFTPNGQRAGFGDHASVPFYGALYLFARQYRRNDVLWWLDEYAFGHDATNSGLSALGLAMLFRPHKAPPAKEPKLEPIKVFKRIGWAALADRWPRPRFYCSTKTGDLAAHHSQRDMNSLQLQVDGEMLLVDLDLPSHDEDLLAERRGDLYQVQARAHNSIVVAEEDHHIDAQGRILQTGQTRKGDVRWVLCDAGSACGESVSWFRTAAMILDPKDHSGQALLVLDQLDLTSPEKVEMFWHTLGTIELGEGTSATLTGRKAKLHAAIASTLSMEPGVRSRRLSRQLTEQTLHLQGGAIGPTLIASVFSRQPLPAPPALEIEDAEVRVVLADRAARFARQGVQLVFDRLVWR